MKRRDFLVTSSLGGLAASRVSGFPFDKPEQASPAPGKTAALSAPQGNAGHRDFSISVSPQPVEKLGRWSLAWLRDYFRKEVESKVIAYWEKYGVDREYGGFLKADRKTGAYPTTDKDLYSQGRILWIYSYLYNNFGRKPAHLEAARQGKEALVKHARLPDGHWGTLYARDWEMKQGFFDIYADIYMILGLAEYHKASGDEEARRLAVDTSFLVNKTVLAPHYQGQGHGPYYEPGIRRLGTWVHFLFPLTLFLQSTKEEGLEPIARFCVRAMLERHWVRKEGFAYECLDDRWKPYPDNYLSLFDDDLYRVRFISGWHSIQAAFKIMLEALRLGSREMFKDGLEFGFQVFKTHWKEGEPCGFYDFMSADDLRRGRGIQSQADSAIYDFIVFALMAIEHALSPEALTCFEKAFSCALSRPEGVYTGSLTLHEPRGVMFSLRIIERLMERGGRASGFLK